MGEKTNTKFWSEILKGGEQLNKTRLGNGAMERIAVRGSEVYH
jgi:hypothetical protein